MVKSGFGAFLTGRKWIAGLFALLALTAVSAASAPAAIEGVWLTESKSEMTITPCLDGWCGYITKIVVPERIKAKYGNDLEAIGTNYTDMLNPDPALRTRPILGLQILKLKGAPNATRFDGEIYNPEDGKSYSGFMQVDSANQLTLNGCVMMGLICRGEAWTRIK